MLYDISTFLCLLLMAIGIFFIFLELKTKIDRNLLVFAVRNLLIGLFCAVDIWIMRGERVSMEWILVQHVLSAFFTPLFVWNIMLISGRVNRLVIKSLFVAAGLFSALFMLGVMLSADANGAIAATALYSFLFEPYLIATLTYLLYLHLTNLLHCASALQKAMRAIQLCGLVLFYGFAVIALSYSTIAASFFRLIGFDISGYAILGTLGTLGYCIIGTMTIFNKFTAVVAEQNASLGSLREAYRDLEATKPLRELGQSSAFINHEIKNYMMVISGYAALLARSKEIAEKDRAMVDNIAQTTAKLQEFSMSVLELSKSKVMHGDKEIELAQSLRSCVSVYFHKQASKISVNCAAPQGKAFISGSPEKLERVFINAFKNAFEAGAQEISVRIYAHNAMALIVIEDDGAGCDAARLKDFFTTFFTTKQSAGGTGLGLCVIRSIVEAHNGNISIYTRNHLGGGKHGMQMQIMIPAGKLMPYEAARSEVMLVKSGLEDAAGILSILKNLKIIPHIAEKVKDAAFAPRNSSLGLAVLAAARQAAEIKAKAGAGAGKKINVLPIEEGPCGTLFVVDGEGERREMLTEEYVANYLVGNYGG
ncbi:MAG: HAMP domain-containing histidine kinase [Chitinispirillales bacterium]|nr:HAMP domain-containing histidine kinase [Chitinispirillales bacterium]